MSWFRCYAGVTSDPKLSLVAVRCGQPRGVVVGAWLVVLDHAQSRRSEHRGTLEAWDDEVAALLLGIPPTAVAQILDAMQGLLLDGDVVRGWQARQFSPDNSTERMRRLRERRRADRALDAAAAAVSAGSDGVTERDVTPSRGDAVTVTVTDPATPQNQNLYPSSVSLPPARGEPVDNSPREPPRRGPVTLAERRQQVEQQAAAGRFARLRPDLAHPPDSRRPFPGAQGAAEAGPPPAPLCPAPLPGEGP